MHQYIIIPKPHDPKTLRFQISRALLILFSPISMLTAIHFNYKLLLQTNEINNLRANRMLPPELMLTNAPVSQQLPQPQFRIRPGFSQLPRKP